MIRNKWIFVVLLCITIGLTCLFLKTSQQKWSDFFTAAPQEGDIGRLKYDNPLLIEHIRKFYLNPPSKENYNLKNDDKYDYSQYEQSSLIAELLKNKRNGFFIECGAFDGETDSNSLLFEK